MLILGKVSYFCDFMLLDRCFITSLQMVLIHAFLELSVTQNELTKKVGGYKHVLVSRNIKVVDGDVVESLRKLPRGTFAGDCIQFF